MLALNFPARQHLIAVNFGRHPMLTTCRIRTEADKKLFEKVKLADPGGETYFPSPPNFFTFK